MKLVHLAGTSTSETMNAQAVCAQNLANTSVPGFKAALVSQRAMPLYGDGHPSRVYVGAESPGYDFSPGPLNFTGEELDVAVANKGWIAVYDEAGKEAYTKRGDFHIENGMLVNGSGNFVLGSGGPISIPAAQSISIMEDGQVNIIPLGNSNATITVGTIKLVNPNEKDLTKNENGLFVLKNGNSADTDSKVKLKSGMLEGSNVKAVNEMIDMIRLAREHELSLKMMHNAETTDQAAAQLLHIS